MVTCIQCGTSLDEGETTCRRCGAKAELFAERGTGEHAPVGTWSEDTGEVDVTEARREAAGESDGGGDDAPAEQASSTERGREASDPGVLRFHDTPQKTDDRPDRPPIRPDRIVRDPDLTPVPGLAVALATSPKPQKEAEATGSRPTLKEAKERPMGQVVPIRRATKSTDEGAAEAKAATMADAAEAESATRTSEGQWAAGGAAGAAAAERTGAEAQREPSEAGRRDASASTSEAGRRDASASTSEAGRRDASVSRSETGRRPPVLASESLREDLAPTEPGRGTIRLVTTIVGLFGAVACAVVGDGSAFVWLVSILLLGCTVLGAAPIRYEARAFALGVLAVAGLAVALVATGVQAVPPVLAIAVTVLGSGLMFRGTYRASNVARALAGAGIVLGLIWFIGSGAIGGLAVGDTSWQSIAGAIARLAFLLLLLLGLLAFMDASTTAGGRVFGSAVLAWYGVFVLLELAVRRWPAPGHVPDGPDGLIARLIAGDVAGPPDALVTAMTVASAALVPIAGHALSHVLVALAGGTTARREAQEERVEAAANAAPTERTNP